MVCMPIACLFSVFGTSSVFSLCCVPECVWFDFVRFASWFCLVHLGCVFLAQNWACHMRNIGVSVRPHLPSCHLWTGVSLRPLLVFLFVLGPSDRLSRS